MMTDWYQKSINTLQLNGKAERTQEAYTRAVRMLSTFYGKSPDEITEPELEAYFLRRRNVDHWSATRCASAPAGFGSSSCTSCNGTGTSSTSCARRTKGGGRRT